jgi:4-diphosphocytidyl-2-C-methyl-D-erythritol kinase
MKNLLDVSAPAKLNLFLHVTGQRADGYHLLQSLFVLIDWADTLHFEKRCDGQVHRHDLGTALPAHDLCLRAAQLLQARSGSPCSPRPKTLRCLPDLVATGSGSLLLRLSGRKSLWHQR